MTADCVDCGLQIEIGDGRLRLSIEEWNPKSPINNLDPQLTISIHNRQSENPQSPFHNPQ